MQTRQGKEIRGIQIEKEDMKLSFFPVDMISRVGKPKELTKKKKSPVPDNNSKAADTSLNHKSQLLYYIPAEKN